MQVGRFVRDLPPTPHVQHVAQQLFRAATSVAANYRASGLARSRAEFTSRISIVLEEADETKFWLEYLSELEATAEMRRKALLDEASQLTRIFSASRRTSLRNCQAAAVTRGSRRRLR